MLCGCSREQPGRWQGYIEGEFVYVAAPLAGQLDELPVRRGDRVAAGAPLFALECSAERAAEREADDELRSARARLADLRKGARPTELAALQARLFQARAASELSALDFERAQKLFQGGAISQSDYDRARLLHEENARLAEELSSELETARLGGRSDAIAAAQAEVNAAKAARERAEWSVAQKRQAAPCSGLVYDTLYRKGEYVAAANPVVALLPPEGIKVRFFVPEAEFAALRAGEQVEVAIPGRPPLSARIGYLSPEPEYTPPVLYNRENRSKLVFMVEAFFIDLRASQDLHPGEPVDVAAGP